MIDIQYDFATGEAVFKFSNGSILRVKWDRSLTELRKMLRT